VLQANEWRIKKRLPERMVNMASSQVAASSTE
jgi:hypothetical protein